METVQYIKTATISPNRHQPRKEFKNKDLEELAESIDQQGLIQPIIVRKMDDLEEGFEYELIAGERRLRAVRDILQKDKIQAIVRSVSEENAQEAAITENLQRQNLNPIEEAIAIQRLMDMHNLTQEQVGKRLGKSRAYVSNTLRLLRLDAEIKSMVSSGTLEPSKAWSLLALDDDTKQIEMAKKAISKGWTVDKIRTEIENHIGKQAEAGVARPSVVKRSVDGQTITVSTPSKGHKRNKLNRDKISKSYIVLVELDSLETVKDFIAYMEEQNWRCWTGERAIQQLANLRGDDDEIETPIIADEEIIEEETFEDA
jgi:ParB family chromosome partitioning protein